MSDAEIRVGEHSADDALVRYLDGESDIAERADVGVHIGQCEICQARLAQLERRSARLRVMLRDADGAWPRAVRVSFKRRVRPRILAAAAMLALVAGAVTVNPVRAWIIERSRAVWAYVTGETAVTPAPPERAPVEKSGGAVSFEPTESVLRVHVATYQAAGTITVEVSAQREVRASVLGAGRAAAFAVLPGELRIANAAADSAGYRLTIPSSLVRVEIVIGNDNIGTFTPARLGERWQVELRR